MLDPSKSICRKLDALYAAGKLDRVEEYLLTELIKNQPRGTELNAAFITVLFELGVYFRKVRKYARARDWFKLLLRIVSVHLGEKADEYAVVLENIASTYELAGEFEPALHYYLKTIQIYKEGSGRAISIRYGRLKRHVCSLFSDRADPCSALIFYPSPLGVKGKEPSDPAPSGMEPIAATGGSKILLFRSKS